MAETQSVPRLVASADYEGNHDSAEALDELSTPMILLGTTLGSFTRIPSFRPPLKRYLQPKDASSAHCVGIKE